MSQAVSISLAKFTESVQTAVKAAIAKHPKFKGELPTAVTVSYLIRGIPVPDGLLGHVTMGETQAYAAEIAFSLARANPEALSGHVEGAVLAIGRHVIVGIPPVLQTVRLEK